MTKMYGDIEDRILWRDIKTGDKSCFDKLFKIYYAELYYYGIKIYPDADFVKECIQGVFIRVWETRANLSDVQNIKSYLLISLRRKILTEKGKEENRRMVKIEHFETSSFIFNEDEFEKHEEVPDEIHKILLKALNSLTNKQREMIMLFFYNELSYSEIAGVIGISVESVRNLMYRTLIHLRESIGEKSIDSMRDMFFLLFSSVSEKKTGII